VGIRGSVTVRDVQPLLNRWHAQVIAGTSGLGRAVTWANTMRPRLPAFDGLQPGDLTVLSLGILRTFNAQVTPETYVIDKQGTILYHGAIDDAPNEARVKKHSLRAALDEVLAGKSVTIAETKAFGCTVKRAPHRSTD